jgi:hypothetical protein
MSAKPTSTTNALPQFCGYCQRYRSGPFRKSGNQGATRICPSCYALRKQGSKRSVSANRAP